MLADSGTRMVIADPATISSVREAVGGLGEAMEAAGYEPAARPRIVTVGTTLAPGERGWDQLIATQRQADARADRPREPGRAALHERDVRPSARRDALAPGAARQHRAGGPGRPADDHRPATSSSACCRSSTSTASTPCSARCCARRPGSCSSTASTPRARSTSSRTRRSRWCRWRRPSSPTGCRCPASRTASARCGWCSAAPPRSTPTSPRPSPRAPSVAIHQGYGLTEAAPVVTSTLCSKDPTPRSVGAALPGHRDPAGRRQRPGAARRGRRRDPHPRRQPVLRLLARRRRRPRRGRLVGHGRRRLPRPDGDLYLVDRVKELVIVSGFNVYPSEVEDVIAELPDVAGGRGHRGRGRDDRRGGRRLREGRPPPGRATTSRTSYAATARTGWPGSSSPR